ncbi:unnamed protein product [Effrenium voratum]|nr:unnamed protein product [Effrenium voratum]
MGLPLWARGFLSRGVGRARGAQRLSRGFGLRRFAFRPPFESFDLHPHTLRGLREALKFPEATEVQGKVLPELLAPEARGSDFVIHARAGTGKTLAFLIPAVEHICRQTPPGIGVLIVASTRELALQITKEAETLCAYHAIQIVPLIGGVRREKDETLIRRRRPQILVGTVAKLTQHFEATLRFETLFEGLSTLVLDECDTLLASNNLELLQTLLSFLPKSASRQTLLLSATIPEEVHHLCASLCRPSYRRLDLVTGVPTQEAVEQLFACTPPLLLATTLRNILDEEIRKEPITHKVIVFFPTARLAAFAAKLFREQLNMRLHELHGRCSESARILAQQEFFEASCGVLFTSMASERGLDYPNVTLVLQVMAPISRQQYIHRVGRTARGGKEGRAFLLLLDREEEPFMPEIADLPVSRAPMGPALLNDEGLHTADALSSARWAKGLPLFAAAAFASLLKHLSSQPGMHPELVARGLKPKRNCARKWRS